MKVIIFDAECLGKDGVIRKYKFYVEEQGNIRVNISTPDGKPKWGCIDFQFDYFDKNTLRVSNMYIDNICYREKGIPEAIIINLSKILKKTIVSSTHFGDNGEHLHKPAKKVWERLVSKGLAYYDDSIGRYRTNIKL